MGSLWCNAWAEHVGIVTNMLGDGIWREGRVRETGVGVKAWHAVLERLHGGKVGIAVHTVIVQVGLVAWAAEVGYPALWQKIRVVAIGELLVVGIDGECGHLLNDSHGVSGGEGGYFSRAAAVRGGDARHDII